MMRRLLIVAVAVAALVGAVVVYGARSSAHDRLTGIVLMAPSASTVIVHHAPFDGMPAMTMTFAMPPGTIVHAGDAIVADVDRAADPWTLSNVHLTAASTPRIDRTFPGFLRVGDRVPVLPLLDQRDRTFSLAALRRPYAITFAYTRCQNPAMCPLVSAKLQRVQTLIAGRPAALVEVSLDPAYDRPPVLARYGSLFGADPARWHLVTGDPKTVLDFAARFGILERSAGPVTIIHSERLAIVDRDDRIQRFVDDTRWQPRVVARELRADVR